MRALVGGAVSLLLATDAFPLLTPKAALAADPALVGTAWADVNGDRKADFCRGDGTWTDARVQCTPSTGSGFGTPVISGALDWGYEAGRAWVDVDGDAKSDYCRVVGDTPSARAQCTLSTGSAFGATITSAVLDWGAHTRRRWADFNGDGKADFCRGVGIWGDGKVQCTVSTGSGFGATFTSAVLDWGYETGLAWVDVNGDAKADYCRVVGDTASARVQCTLSTGTGFGATFTSAVLDWGAPSRRAWADFNGDGKADYCRSVGAWGDNGKVQCTVSTGSGFGATFTSDVLDWGYEGGLAWVDANGDGKADYCRLVGNAPNGMAQCTLSTGSGFGTTFTSAVLEFGHNEGMAWADVNGDAKADFCRRVGTTNDINSPLACTVSTGSGFGGTISQETAVQRAHRAFSRVLRPVDSSNHSVFTTYLAMANAGASYDALVTRITRDYVAQAYDKIFRYRNDPAFSPTSKTAVPFSEDVYNRVLTWVKAPGPLSIDGNTYTFGAEAIWTYVAKSAPVWGAHSGADTGGEKCFGAMGPACNGTGIEGSGQGPQSVDVFQRLDGMEMRYVDIRVAVGSIAHDRSCLDAGYVAYCNGFPDSRSGGMEASCNNSGEDCAGVREWWKAAANNFDGRFWRYRFGPYPLDVRADSYQDDIRIVGNRPTGLPLTNGSKSRTFPYSNGEAAVTTVLYAPIGTAIDYTDSAFCATQLGSTTQTEFNTTPWKICSSGGSGGGSGSGGGNDDGGPIHVN